MGLGADSSDGCSLFIGKLEQVYISRFVKKAGGQPGPRLTGQSVAALRVEHSAEGTVVTLDSGVALSLGEGETVAFPKPKRSPEGEAPDVLR